LRLNAAPNNKCPSRGRISVRISQPPQITRHQTRQPIVKPASRWRGY